MVGWGMDCLVSVSLLEKKKIKERKEKSLSLCIAFGVFISKVLGYGEWAALRV